MLHERAEALLALPELGLDPFGLDRRPLEQLDRERDAERGEHREAVHERLLHERRRDAERDRELAERSSAATLQHHRRDDGARSREPDAVDRAEDSPIASIGPQPMAYITAVIPKVCTATRAHSRQPSSYSPQSAVATHDARNATTSNPQRSQSGVDAIRSSRRAAQNTGATTGSVSSVGSMSRVHRAGPEARRSSEMTPRAAIDWPDGALTGRGLIGAGEWPTARSRRAEMSVAGRGGVERPAEVEALGEVAAARGQRLGLGGALDALGDGHQPERVRDLHDGPDEQRARPGEDVAHERAVDLQQVDRELLEVGERRVAGAEVVDGEPHAEVAQPPEPDGRRGRVLHQRALGDLEDQPVGLEAAAAEQRLDPVGEPRRRAAGAARRSRVTDGAAVAPTASIHARRLLARGDRARAGRSRR